MKIAVPLLVLIISFSAVSWAVSEGNTAGSGDAVELPADVATDTVSAASPYVDADFTGTSLTIISILAIVFIFGTPIMVVAAVLYASHRKRRLAREMASEFLAKGQQVPPEVWRGLAGDATSRSNLHKGMVMLGAGLGIFLCFWLIGRMEAAYLGLIPLFIGIAQLLIWRLERNAADRRE